MNVRKSILAFTSLFVMLCIFSGCGLINGLLPKNKDKSSASTNKDNLNKGNQGAVITMPVETEPTEFSPYWAYVNGKDIVLRKEPSASAEIIGSASLGEEIRILQIVTSGGISWASTDRGWISMDHISTTPPDIETTQTPEETVPSVTDVLMGTVTATDVCIRKGPSTGYDYIYRVDTHHRLAITAFSHDGAMMWGKTTDGWISMNFVRLDGTTNVATLPGNVCASGAEVKDVPSSYYETIEVLAPGRQIMITELRTENNTVWGRCGAGWVCMDDVILKGNATVIQGAN